MQCEAQETYWKKKQTCHPVWCSRNTVQKTHRNTMQWLVSLVWGSVVCKLMGYSQSILCWVQNAGWVGPRDHLERCRKSFCQWVLIPGPSRKKKCTKNILKMSWSSKNLCRGLSNEKIHWSFVHVVFTPENERGLIVQPVFQQKALDFQKQLQHGE